MDIEFEHLWQKKKGPLAPNRFSKKMEHLSMQPFFFISGSSFSKFMGL